MFCFFQWSRRNVLTAALKDILFSFVFILILKVSKIIIVHLSAAHVMFVYLKLFSDYFPLSILDQPFNQH